MGTQTVFNGKDIHVAFKAADGTYKDLGEPITKLETFTVDFGKAFDESEILGTELKTFIEGIRDCSGSFTRQMDYKNFAWFVRNNPMGCDVTTDTPPTGGPTYTDGKLTNEPTSDTDGWIIDIVLNYTYGAAKFADEKWLDDDNTETNIETDKSVIILRCVCMFGKFTPNVPAGGYGTEDIPLTIQRVQVIAGDELVLTGGTYDSLHESDATLDD